MSSQYFPNGAAWLRADFHLHTRADKEFKYTDDSNRFVTEYVEALEAAGISIGLIANHNKFDKTEFKGLRKAASKRGIFLIPGVELSIGDGHNGIHTLIAFSDAWLEGEQIDTFLRRTFGTRTPAQFERENGRSGQNLIDTLKSLEGHHRDFFVVFAHVEAKSGLWKELGGGRLQEFSSDALFQKRVLGFQKVRTRDERKVMKDHFGNAYPAEVEGCDCKSIQALVDSKETAASYLKVGAYSFEAVKYALLDHKDRCASTPPELQRSYIESVSFEGGVLDGKTIRFSHELNTLIGIRGSGKSSILEALRYALAIPYGDGATDLPYKKSLIGHTLGSGGRITVVAHDRHGQQYGIRRIFREKPEVFSDGHLQPGVSIDESIIHKPVYFGQKDLSSSGAGFEKDLIEKLVGQKLSDIRSQIDAKREGVTEAISALLRLDAADDQVADYKDKKLNAEHQLKFYKEHGIDEKMQKQVAFDDEERRCLRTVSIVTEFADSIENVLNEHEELLKKQPNYESKHNGKFFTEFFASFEPTLTSFGKLKEALTLARESESQLEKKAAEFSDLKSGLKDEFAAIERELAEELKREEGDIRLDDFKKIQSDLNKANRMLESLRQRTAKRAEAKKALSTIMSELNSLWHDEFRLIKAELDLINNSQDALQVKAEYKGNKISFLDYMCDLFRGTGIRETTYQKLATEYSDPGAIYEALEVAKSTVGTKASQFEERFLDNLPALLTWQVPNEFTIEYHGKALKQHSLGQRASALILFILSQEDHDLILIDQPEDDLDNQTIYQDLIQLVCRLKPKTQFIFATHNPNFPVLGDAEQILSCEYEDGTITAHSGSIDDPDQQKRVVEIMEGGSEALQKRQQRYEAWTHQNS